MDSNRGQANVVPFARHRHVIHEIDLVRLIDDHRRRAGLCDRLEAVADMLPARLAPEAADAIERSLAALADRNERDGRACPVAMLLDGRDDPLARALLDHVRLRHAADAGAAQELIGALDSAAAPDRAASAETLGHMLRGFFTGCRRAMDFEQLAILTLAGHRLTPAARALLIDALAQRARA